MGETHSLKERWLYLYLFFMIYKPYMQMLQKAEKYWKRKKIQRGGQLRRNRPITQRNFVSTKSTKWTKPTNESKFNANEIAF